MSLEIKVGPPQLAIHQGHTVLLTEPDGQINRLSHKGLYFYDTRVISNWTMFANGEPWDLLNGGTITSFDARIFLVNRELITEAGLIAPHTVGLVLSREIGGGVHEDVDLINYGQSRVRFNLEIALRSDFADIFEVKSGRFVRRGHIATKWSEHKQRLTTTYRNEDFLRKLTVTARRSGTPAAYANGRLTFDIELAPGAHWHSCLTYDLSDGHKSYPAPDWCAGHDGDCSENRRRLLDWQGAVLKLESSNDALLRLFRQATDDLAALRLPVHGASRSRLVPAAGLPWFVALFGRDSLITSLQTLLVYSDFACGTLDVLGVWQATECDEYRDAEPGKIMHELRLGELARLKLVPHTPYYGTADATPLYLITLHAAWCCTGDHALLNRHLATAKRCLEWIDRYGDRDGDGFQEYATRSSAGLENQSWKDSGDAVVYPDGTLVTGPKALCELQGYVYDAWLRMAQIYDALGDADSATALRKQAAALFTRFNEAFWDEATGFYAFALDGEKKKVLSVASNPGHCLWSGIVPPERAGRVVARLMQPDMWSGWGIRTLSATHPAYNPYSYQSGSVWPHDNGLIAQGFKRYGYAGETGQIMHDVCGAGRFFALDQLPELFGGLNRNSTNFPVQYPGANVPQAWAAGSVFSLLQALLGLQPDAPHRMLYVDPVLPPWLDDITLRDLRVGEQIFDLRFSRAGRTTEFEVVRGDPTSVARREMTVWSDLLKLGADGTGHP
ncbi:MULTISPECIES: amylo-alpha-1,6-glucosidase [Paraburkholderia]|uniref:amylo-alpha-1,6-glucosidase n=1 Tax=Paraburkholderia TaxID=1822464 RepID=UPI00036DCB3B|nr:MULTISPECIES: glycogen debranching N-terminal domain-containing protein [Paraburkholderia]MDH6147312.1 glycogen debranching enzyme [Paraburkholderia sp. WSM4179]